MKTFCVIIISGLLLLEPVFAHPGGTDSNGGHHDRSTGEYHYHHGYSAHQHIGGSCPYDFDDQTGKNSGSAGNRDLQNKEPTTVEPIPDVTQKKEPAGIVILKVIALLFGNWIALLGLLSVLHFVVSIASAIIQKFCTPKK